MESEGEVVVLCGGIVVDLEGEAGRLGVRECEGLSEADRLGDMEMIGAAFFGGVEKTSHAVVKGFDGGDGFSTIIADISDEIEGFVVEHFSSSEVDAAGQSKGAVPAFWEEGDFEAFDGERERASDGFGDAAFFDQDVEESVVGFKGLRKNEAEDGFAFVVGFGFPLFVGFSVELGDHPHWVVWQGFARCAFDREKGLDFFARAVGFSQEV